MQSNAGYYIGHGYWDQELSPDTKPEDVTEEMKSLLYSRESDYFASHEGAQAYLDSFDD